VNALFGALVRALVHALQNGHPKITKTSKTGINRRNQSIVINA
jgi:hypothetical protein